MSLVPNRTPWALRKALAGKKMPAGTRSGTADLEGHTAKKYANLALSNLTLLNRNTTQPKKNLSNPT